MLGLRCAILWGCIGAGIAADLLAMVDRKPAAHGHDPSPEIAAVRLCDLNGRFIKTKSLFQAPANWEVASIVSFCGHVRKYDPSIVTVS